MLSKLVAPPGDRSDTQIARTNKMHKSPLQGLAVKIEIGQRDEASPLSSADVSVFGFNFSPFATASFTSKCSTAMLSVKASDVKSKSAIARCLGPSSASMVNRPVTYADIDGAQVNLQVLFDDQGSDVATPTVTLTGTRTTLTLEELTRTKVCDSKMACFKGTLRVSQL
jgi:hypothetical protein